MIAVLSSAYVRPSVESSFSVAEQRSHFHITLSLSATPKFSFGNRMKNIVMGEAAKKKIDKSLPSNLKIVTTLQEYKDVVGCEKERIVVVRFFAQWCKACKAIQPIFYGLANRLPKILFVDVPITESNANLHQGLGIPSLPFGHIYTPTGGLVEELRITRPLFSTFAKKLKSYISGSCELIDGDTVSPYEPAIQEKATSHL